jgi:hypothetical protein
MFQITFLHNDESFLNLQETIEECESFGLTLVSKTFDSEFDEWTLILQGTKDQLFSWNDALMEGGPSWNEEEFMEELVQVA